MRLSARIVLGLAGVLLLGASPPQAQVSLDVQLVAHGEQTAPVHARISAVPADLGGAGGEVVAARASEPRAEIEVGSAPVQTQVSLAADRAMRIWVTAEGFWSEPKVLQPPFPDVVRFELWPAGRLLLRVQVAEDREPIERVSFRLVTTDGRLEGQSEQQPARAELRCEVRKGELARCPAPAGRWNIRVAAQSWSPQIFWDRTLPAKSELDLGTWRPRAGGTVVGQVFTEGAGAPPDSVTVRLLPASVSSSSRPDAAARLRQYRTSIGPEGWFQFNGVASGSWRLIAAAPPLQPAKRFPVRVQAGHLTRLQDPLILRQPLRLSVHVTPPRDLLGRPWHVDLLRPEQATHHLEEVDSGNTDAAGLWRSAPVSAGTYYLRLISADGNNLVWRELVVNESGQEVWIELDPVLLEGRVLLGDEPLAAELSFGTRESRGSLETKSDEEGEFFLVLPHAGDWIVDVWSPNPWVEAEGLEVAVEAEAGNRAATVEIRIPDGVLMGSVVDSQGGPVARAHIEAFAPTSPRNRFEARSDTNGAFEIHGFERGNYRVHAERGGAVSDAVVAHIDPKGAATSVRLILRETRQLEGRVMADGRAINGAEVFAVPLGTASAAPSATAKHARTGPAGRFVIELPADATGAQLVVLAPGYRLAWRRIRLRTREEPLIVSLRPGGGELILVRPETNGSDSGEIGYVTIDGSGVVGLSLLRYWASLHRQQTSETPLRVQIPAMAAGNYAYCGATYEEVLLVLTGRARPARESCTSGFLSPGGSLTLELPG